MTAHLIIGVDPGANGAVAFLWQVPAEGAAPVSVVPIPRVRMPFQTQDSLDVSRFCGYIRQSIYAVGDPAKVHVGIEQSWARPNQSISSATSLLLNAGRLEGAAIACGVGVSLVPPSVWKAFYAELKGGVTRKERKDLSLNLARSMWPEIDLRYAKDDGKAEALLIANFTKHDLERRLDDAQSGQERVPARSDRRGKMDTRKGGQRKVSKKTTRAKGH